MYKKYTSEIRPKNKKKKKKKLYYGQHKLAGCTYTYNL